MKPATSFLVIAFLAVFACTFSQPAELDRCNGSGNSKKPAVN
jgi:hypothetical protein